MGDRQQTAAEVVAVCTWRGRIPRMVVPEAEVTEAGLVGDGHQAEKHSRPHRAVLIQDLELLDELALARLVRPGRLLPGQGISVTAAGKPL